MGHAPRRVFLGWERACLESARDHLIAAHTQSARVDLSGPLLVVPGGRARRTLLALLVEACDAQGLMLIPPTMLTPGEIGDALLAAPLGRRVAPPLVKRLAWIQALRAATPETLAALIRRAPDPDDLVRWSVLAALLESRHAELVGELLLFEDVPERARSLPDFPDEERWLAAGRIQRAYADVLERWRLFDPSLERLRVVRAWRRGEAREGGPPSGQDVVLIGVPELNRATRAILERDEIAVTALVFAPESLGDRFDDLGCVGIDAWADARLDFENARILVGEAPDDQADAAFEALAALDAQYATDEIVIGVPDASVVPYLRQRAGRYGGVELRYAAGVPVRQTPPFRLLALIADFLESGSFDAFASLVRHPDVEAILERRLAQPDRKAWWIDEIDQYRARHVQERADGQWLASDPREHTAGVRAAFRHVVERLEPLAPDRPGPHAPRAPIECWALGALDVLGRIYGGVERNRMGEERLVIESCFAVRGGVESLIRQAGALDEIPATPAQTLRLLLDQVRDDEIPERPSEETIEMLGWLELALEPAPVVVVTGMNEGVVPSTLVADAMLPDALRRVLGIADDRRRLARDTFLLAAIVASREHACLIAGRRNPDGDPLKPSRLLLKADDATALSRLARFTADRPDERRTLRLVSFLTPGGDSLFTQRRIVPMPIVDSLRVTAFRDYLASPYQFYLKHVAGAEEREQEPREIGPAPFGSLIHDVLDAFGRGDARHAEEPRRVEESVMDHLDAFARAQFGARPRAPVAIQIELARLRLREFAAWQAERTRDGWRILVTEWRPDTQRAAFDVDGRTMWLRGKIDRIDEKNGALAIIDYKTGDGVLKPESAHRGRDGWKDLQLPLYRHLAAELGVGNDAVLAYVALPKREGEVNIYPAKWDETDLRSADDAARDVVRAIRAGRFEELGNPYLQPGAIARLCGYGLIGAGEGESGGSDGGRGDGGGPS